MTCKCIDTRLCGTCTRVMLDDIQIISGHIGTHPFRTLLEELDVTITKTDRIATMNVGPVSTGDDEQPLAYNDEASEVARLTRRRLVHVWRRVCVVNPHLSMSRSPEDISKSLYALRNLIVKHPKVSFIAYELRSLVSSAQEVIDRPRDRWYLGVCKGRIDGMSCGTSLYAFDGTETLRCRFCMTSYDVEERKLEMLEMLKEEKVTTSQAEGLLWPNGGVLTKSAIRGMKQRGVIDSVGKTPKGALLFRLGDITEVMLRRNLT